MTELHRVLGALPRLGERRVDGPQIHALARERVADVLVAVAVAGGADGAERAFALAPVTGRGEIKICFQEDKKALP